ncbi:LysM peptidoglycan-binding domain-containing protein [Bacillus kexueae]|uniref:LysM peptidoglycan-binding domain-containing protein n=1 Tax=Aeribacillus kexueae TaxID=2078952 RepID=UPI001FB00EE6|nr:LysM peptidoglycan-binding domain-containing protein [Bacillus kexueae]
MRVVHTKVQLEKNKYVLYVYVDGYTTEFSNEFQQDDEIPSSLRHEIRNIVQKRYPHLKITAVKVVIGTMLVAGFPFSSKATYATSNDPSVREEYPLLTYRVQGGDTLYLIAEKFRTSIAQLKSFNQLSSNTIYPGQELTIPAFSYEVTSGDSLSLIAKKFGTTVDSIKEMNKLTSDVIFAGQHLLIPATASNEKAAPSKPLTDYTVVKGDSLSLIAKRFSMTVEELKQLNGLSTDHIYIGQTVKVYAKSVEEEITEGASTSTYIVVAGDTLSLIAKKFNVTVDSLKKVNQLTTDVIYVGQSLKIPTQPENPVQTQTHVVEAGDTLYKIAVRYGVTVQDIKEKNNLQSDVIYVGQRIIIPIQQPVSNDNTNVEETYVVAQGDTLSLIAKKHNTTVDAIKALNGLNTDIIYVGQTLKIPTNQWNDLLEIREVVVEEVIHSQNQRNLTIRGVANPNGKIRIEAGTVEHVTTANESGEFSTEVDVSSLPDGSFEIRVLAYNDVRSSNPIIREVVKDTKGPSTLSLYVTPTINQLNQNNFVIRGESEPNATIFISLTDGTLTKTYDVQVSASGQFEVGVDVSGFHEGAIQMMAKATDSLGNVGKEQKVTTIKDTHLVKPTVHPLSPIRKDNVHQYTIIGDAEPQSAVFLTITDGVNQPIERTVKTDLEGRFIASLDLSDLSDQPISITVRSEDEAGNKSDPVVTTVIKDTNVEVPRLTNIPILTSVNAKTYTIEGTGEPNSKVQAIFRNQLGQELSVEGSTDSTGKFQLEQNLSSVDFVSGEIEVYVQDAVGNVSPSSIIPIKVDQEGPNDLLIEQLDDISRQNVSSYKIKGTTEQNATVFVTISDGYKQTVFETKASDTGDFTIELNGSEWKDGLIFIRIEAIDELGNRGAIFEKQIQKDTVQPTSVVISNHLGEINSSNQRDFVIRGTSEEDGAIVKIHASDGQNDLEKTALVTNGTFEIPIDVSTLQDGLITFSVSQRDEVGNESDSVKFSINKDTESVTPVILESLVRNIGGAFSYLIKGKGEEGATISLTITSNIGSETFQLTALEDGSFNFEMNVTNHLQHRPLITVQQIDKAGNESRTAIVGISSYIVGAGDTLWKVANRFGTTVTELMTLNQLQSSTIYIGQTIFLPTIAGLQVSAIPETEAFNMGYLYFGTTKEFIDTMNQTSGTINVVSPTYFDLNSDGSLKLTSQTDRFFVANMQANGIRVVPFLSNHWDQEVGVKALENREKLAEQIAEAIYTYNLDGVNVDIENVSHVHREAYVDLVRLLREKLPEGKEVSVAVAANPEGLTTGWQGSYDYKQLADYSDYLMIMSYDESYPGSEPGPVASLEFVEKSIQYALNQGVPKEKIVMGIGHYGRYWKIGEPFGGHGISNQQVRELVEQYNGSITFDEETMSPKATFTIGPQDPPANVYGRELTMGTYIVWFEDERSMKAKYDLIKKYGIKGTGNWGMAQENPEFWEAFKTWVSDVEKVNGEGIE